MHGARNSVAARFGGRVVALATSALSAEAPPSREPGAPFEVRGDVAIVTVRGPLSRVACDCFDSYPAIAARFDAALKSPQRTIVLRVDSPGGDAVGADELGAALREKAAKAKKALVAWCEGEVLGSAFVLACAASAVHVMPTAAIGGVGAMKLLVDVTGADRAMGLNFATIVSGARKADGNPHVPISRDALKASQGEVDAVAAIMFGAVARARGLKASEVQALQGRALLGAAAVRAKLADAVSPTLEALLHNLATAARAPKATRPAAPATSRRSPGVVARSNPTPGDTKKKEEGTMGRTQKISKLTREVERLSTLAGKGSAEDRARLLEALTAAVKALKKYIEDESETDDGDKEDPILEKAKAMNAASIAHAKQGADLDARMGLAAPTHAVRHDGTRSAHATMTPAQARAYAAKKGAAK